MEDTPPGPRTTKRGGPSGFPSSPFLPRPSSDPPQLSQDYASTKSQTTAAPTTQQYQPDIHNLPKLGDFSSLDLSSLFPSAHLSSAPSTTISTPNSIPLESADYLSPATTSTSTPTERLPYNILRVPKLGDFSSLGLRPSSDLTPEQTECSSGSSPKLKHTHPTVSEARPSLGDFSKIFDTFGYTPRQNRQSTADMSTPTTYKCPGARAKAGDKTAFHRCCWARKTTPASSDAEEDAGSEKKATDKAKAYVCPHLRAAVKQYKKPATAQHYNDKMTAMLEAVLKPSTSDNDFDTTPGKARKSRRNADTDTDWRSGCSSVSSSDNETDITIPTSPVPVKVNKRKSLDPVFKARKLRAPKTDDDIAFEYESEFSLGPVPFTKAFLEKHPRFEKADSAIEKQRNLDIELEITSTAAKEDVHVFLDVSNIQISMMNTIKKALDIPSQAQFTPAPGVDWDALLQIILRGRSYKTRFAACSKKPTTGSRNPLFVNHVKRAGFEVNCRDRKLVDGRWVEDLVDEMIQASIHDTVENTETPGTIVIVTGDGQPAKQAAGFKAYAESALKKGWNVEVVCWKMGCSHHWHDESWKEYGLRYRLIKLDDYLGNLFSPLK